MPVIFKSRILDRMKREAVTTDEADEERHRRDLDTSIFRIKNGKTSLHSRHRFEIQLGHFALAFNYRGKRKE